MFLARPGARAGIHHLASNDFGDDGLGTRGFTAQDGDGGLAEIYGSVHGAHHWVSAAADEPTRAISPGASVSGIIDPSGDVDNFTINLVAGQTYAISLRGTGASPLEDGQISLSRATGTVASDDDGGVGTNSFLTFTASISGTYQIAAEAYPGSGLTGGYTLDVRQMMADSVGGTLASAEPVVLGETHFGFIETSADVDMFAVTLVAGQFYNFEVAGGADNNTDPLAVPGGELDTRMAIYDAAGNVLFQNDDISYPDDVSSAVVFQATTSGTHYIKIDAYPQQTGGFALDVRELDLSTLNPLDTIDYGSQLASNDVTVYFATAGETFDGVSSLGWSQYEIDRAMAALDTWAQVANIHISIASSAAGATFKLVTTESDEFLGYFHPPGDTHAGVGVFAVNGAGWDSSGGLEQGGYGFDTLVHEFGHALGLAHPHDDGGTSTIMPGVTSPFGSYGPFDLNQGVYTAMSYNDGWPLHPDAATTTLPVTYGYQGGPSALDIAVVQEKYGTVAHNAGNTVYVLSNTNGPGTYWHAIWDTGGIDTIKQIGALGARIDLTAATLDYSATGGGVISYATGVFGGFTIAAGVVIENATGGSGADVLIGNQVGNVLKGGGGNDLLNGAAGSDTLIGGDGNDTADYTGSIGAVTVDLRILTAQDTGAAGTDTLASIENLIGGSSSDTLNGNDGLNVLNGAGGQDRLVAYAGNDTLDGGTGADQMYGGLGNDSYYVDTGSDKAIEKTAEGIDTVFSSVSFSLASNIENLQLSGSAIRATGNNLANILTGTGGDNVLNGGGGGDILRGGGGNDIYYVDNVGDSIVESSGAGIDEVNATVSYALASNVEKLLLRGSASINGTGNALDNVLQGNSGANVLTGGSGDDKIVGGGGADKVIGGVGSDILWGSAGADKFVFDDGDFGGLTASTADDIRDFSHSQGDRIDLSAVDANSLTGGDQSFAFIGSADFHHVAGELRYEEISGNTYVYGDTDGDGIADFMIRLDGSHALTSGDFVI